MLNKITNLVYIVYRKAVYDRKAVAKAKKDAKEITN